MIDDFVEEVGITGEIIAAQEARRARGGIGGNSASPLRRTRSLTGEYRQAGGRFHIEPVSYGKNSRVLGRVPGEAPDWNGDGFFSEMNDRASKLIRSNTSEARRYHSLSNFIDLHSQELEAGDNFPSLEDITWSNIAKGYKQKAGSYHKSLYADIHAVYKYMSLHYYYRNGFPKNKNIDKFGLFKENWEKLNNARMPFWMVSQNLKRTMMFSIYYMK